MRRRVTLVALAATALAACGDDGPSAVDASTIALRGDGLAVTDLGAAPADAIDAVTDELGPPDVDSGWDPAGGAYGTCPGDRVRGVEWGGLVLLFTDGDTEHGSGEHLFTWYVSGAPPAISTARGLGIGATAADAEDLYPGQVEVVPAQAPFPGLLEVAADGGEITAYLDDADTITNLEAGTPCAD